MLSIFLRRAAALFDVQASGAGVQIKLGNRSGNNCKLDHRKFDDHSLNRSVQT